MLFNKSSSLMRSMPLEGMEALDLYLAKISSNIGSINHQVELLRIAIAEKEDLLRKHAANGGEEEGDPE